MNNYRVGYTACGRCQSEYVKAHTKAAAIFKTLESCPEGKSHNVIEVPDSVKSDKQWAENRS